jgi:hypothetical protein
LNPADWSGGDVVEAPEPFRRIATPRQANACRVGEFAPASQLLEKTRFNANMLRD